MRRAALILVMLALPVAAHAQVDVQVALSPNGQALATQLGVSTTDLQNQIATQVNNAYDTANVNTFLRKFADATSFAMRGIGVDYMSLPHSLILGIGGQIAVASESEFSNASTAQHPAGGLAANVSIMAGLNLGEWDHPRWTIFANGFYRNGSTENLSGGITTAGAHIQYRLVAPQTDEGASVVIRWIGLDLTSGIEFTRWTLGATHEISTSFDVAGNSGQSTGLTLATAGNVQFDLASTAETIPIELTTGLRIVEIVSLYVGGGFAIQTGKSTLTANLTGDVHTSDGMSVGTVTMTGGGSNTASPGTGYGLAGLQVNLWKLKVYTQINATLHDASLGFGLRLVL